MASTEAIYTKGLRTNGCEVIYSIQHVINQKILGGRWGQLEQRYWILSHKISLGGDEHPKGGHAGGKVRNEKGAVSHTFPDSSGNLKRPGERPPNLGQEPGIWKFPAPSRANAKPAESSRRQDRARVEDFAAIQPLTRSTRICKRAEAFGRADRVGLHTDIIAYAYLLVPIQINMGTNIISAGLLYHGFDSSMAISLRRFSFGRA